MNNQHQQEILGAVYYGRPEDECPICARKGYHIKVSYRCVIPVYPGKPLIQPMEDGKRHIHRGRVD